jgi:hypothetical protein
VKPSKAGFGLLLMTGLALSSLTACAGAAQSSSSKAHEPAEGAPLVPPKTSPAEDARYLTDVAKSDSHLATYVQQQGNVALKAMLTDGTAFCAFLRAVCSRFGF